MTTTTNTRRFCYPYAVYTYTRALHAVLYSTGARWRWHEADDIAAGWRAAHDFTTVPYPAAHFVHRAALPVPPPHRLPRLPDPSCLVHVGTFLYGIGYTDRILPAYMMCCLLCRLPARFGCTHTLVLPACHLPRCCAHTTATTYYT